MTSDATDSAIPRPTRAMPDVPMPDVPMPEVPVPDDKDWTWVLDRPCADCGFDPSAVAATEVAALVRARLPRWQGVLARSDVAARPAPTVWSPLEYGCHVRDVFTRFEERIGLMVGADDPLFDNWDQDATALADRYWEQDPAVVSDQLCSAGEQIAVTLSAVHGSQWERVGRRTNGSVFTVDSLARYFAHDIEHHLVDVSG